VEAGNQLNVDQPNLDRERTANEKELTQFIRDKADYACTLRTLSQNINESCRELAGLQTMRATLNATTKQIDAAGKKPMTAAELQAHRQRLADINRTMVENEKKIVFQSRKIDLLLPEGEGCRRCGKELALRGRKLNATRRELTKKAAILDGKQESAVPEMQRATRWAVQRGMPVGPSPSGENDLFSMWLFLHRQEWRKPGFPVLAQDAMLWP
jgi:hypothetical protein